MNLFLLFADERCLSQDIIKKKSSNQSFSFRRFDVSNGCPSRLKSSSRIWEPLLVPSPFLLSLSFSLSTATPSILALCFLSFRFRLINSIPSSLSVDFSNTLLFLPSQASSISAFCFLISPSFLCLHPFLRFPFLSPPLFLPFIRAQRYAQTISYYSFFFFHSFFSFSIRASTAFVCFHLYAFVRYSILPRLLPSPSFLFLPLRTQNSSLSLPPFRLVFSHRDLLFIPGRFRFLSTFISSFILSRAMIDVVCLPSTIFRDLLPQRDHLSLHFLLLPFEEEHFRRSIFLGQSFFHTISRLFTRFYVYYNFFEFLFEFLFPSFDVILRYIVSLSPVLFSSLTTPSFLLNLLTFFSFLSQVWCIFFRKHHPI